MTDFKLVYDGLELNLDKYTSGTRPRSKLKIPELSHSNNGTPATDGTNYEPLHLWDITCLIDTDQRLILDRVYARFQTDKAAIVLHDYSQFFVEHGTRTRPLATGATENSATGDVYYYAQFSVWFNSEPRYGLAGGYDLVTLSFTEFQKLTI